MIINLLRLPGSYWPNREHMNCHQARDSHIAELQVPFSNGFVMKGGNSACPSLSLIGQILASLKRKFCKSQIAMGLWDITLIVGITMCNAAKRGQLNLWSFTWEALAQRNSTGNFKHQLLVISIVSFLMSLLILSIVTYINEVGNFILVFQSLEAWDLLWYHMQISIQSAGKRPHLNLALWFQERRRHY